jgi:hypothetical protein
MLVEEEVKVPNKGQLAEDEDLIYGGKTRKRTQSTEQRRDKAKNQ